MFLSVPIVGRGNYALTSTLISTCVVQLFACDCFHVFLVFCLVCNCKYAEKSHLNKLCLKILLVVREYSLSVDYCWKLTV